MSTSSRATQISRLLRVLKKEYQPVLPAQPRSLFEDLLFACLLENSPHDTAEKVFETMRKEYFDWNEARVSTVRELAEVMKPLVDPAEAANRFKQTLHSTFEAVYQFDLETMKKQNIGQAVKHLNKLPGTTPFVVAYVTQNSLAGHSIPVNNGLLVAMHVIGVISDSELEKRVVPGLERAVPKTKGVEIGSLLHQLGVEVGRNPYGQSTRKLLLKIDSGCQSRLPKRAPKRAKVEEPPAKKKKPAKKAAAEKPAKTKTAKKAKAPAKSKPVAKTAAKTAAKKKKKKPAKKTAAAKKPAKKKKKAPAKKKPAVKKKKKTARKTTNRRLSKRKPR